MNERNNASPPANIGISLLLSVFLVLCLFTFSAIALVQAENEWHQASLTKENRDAYYAAVNQAESELRDLNKQAETTKASSLKKKMKKEYPISDSQALSVVFRFNKKKGDYSFTEFRTIATKTWEGDDSLNVIH